MLRNTFYNFEKKRVYYDTDGTMCYGEKNIEGKWYYFDKVTGAMQTGLYKLPNKTVCYNGCRL